MDDVRTAGSAVEDGDLLHVKLPEFDGPLDLLLHLVRKHELEIHDLRLADLTEPYLAHLERIQELDLDTAGEFLAIASTLVWIKSKSLLPRDFTEEEPDPSEMEALLLQRLQEYQRIKDAAQRLTGLDLLGRDLFPRQVPTEEEPDGREAAPIQIDPVSLFELIEAFRGVLEQSREHSPIDVAPESEPIEHRVESLLMRFARQRELAFRDLFDAEATKSELVLVFISLLELVRLKAIRIAQSTPGGEILCQVTDSFGQSGAEWKTAVLNALFGTGGDLPHASGRAIA